MPDGPVNPETAAGEPFSGSWRRPVLRKCNARDNSSDVHRATGLTPVGRNL